MEEINPRIQLVKQAEKIQTIVLKQLHNANIPSPVLSMLSGIMYSMSPEKVIDLSDKIIGIARELGAQEWCCMRASTSEGKIHSIGCEHHTTDNVQPSNSN